MNKFLTILSVVLLSPSYYAEAAEPEAPAMQPKQLRFKADRILFLGNSITLHPPAPEIGWTSDCGMAASALEKDYVHLLTESIATLAGRRPQCSVVTIVDFEKNYDTYDFQSRLTPLLKPTPDVVVMAIGENVSPLDSEAARAKFKDAFMKLLTTIKQNGRPVTYVRSCFWPDSVKDSILRQCCEETGGVFVDIGHLGRDESNYARAERTFTHDGVAAHPGDKGMKAIADAVFEAMTNQ